MRKPRRDGTRRGSLVARGAKSLRRTRHGLSSRLCSLSDSLLKRCYIFIGSARAHRGQAEQQSACRAHEVGRVKRAKRARARRARTREAEEKSTQRAPKMVGGGRVVDCRATTYARIHARDVVHVLARAVPTALCLNALRAFLILDHQPGALVGLCAVLVSGQLGVNHLFLVLLVSHFISCQARARASFGERTYREQK